MAEVSNTIRASSTEWCTSSPHGENTTNRDSLLTRCLLEEEELAALPWLVITGGGQPRHQARLTCGGVGEGREAPTAKRWLKAVDGIRMHQSSFPRPHQLQLMGSGCQSAIPNFAVVSVTQEISATPNVIRVIPW